MEEEKEEIDFIEVKFLARSTIFTNKFRLVEREREKERDRKNFTFGRSCRRQRN